MSTPPNKERNEGTAKNRGRGGYQGNSSTKPQQGGRGTPVKSSGTRQGRSNSLQTRYDQTNKQQFVQRGSTPTYGTNSPTTGPSYNTTPNANNKDAQRAPNNEVPPIIKVGTPNGPPRIHIPPPPSLSMNVNNANVTNEQVPVPRPNVPHNQIPYHPAHHQPHYQDQRQVNPHPGQNHMQPPPQQTQQQQQQQPNQPQQPPFMAFPPNFNIARARSAPPNLGEQERLGALFFPEKSIKGPFPPVPLPFYGGIPYAMPMGMPPHMPPHVQQIPGMPPGYHITGQPVPPGPLTAPPPSTGQHQPPLQQHHGQPANRPKPKVIPIIDPNTGKEVVTNSPPKSRLNSGAAPATGTTGPAQSAYGPPSATPFNPSQKSGTKPQNAPNTNGLPGMLPEFSKMVPPASNNESPRRNEEKQTKQDNEEKPDQNNSEQEKTQQEELQEKKEQTTPPPTETSTQDTEQSSTNQENSEEEKSQEELQESHSNEEEGEEDDWEHKDESELIQLRKTPDRFDETVTSKKSDMDLDDNPLSDEPIIKSTIQYPSNDVWRPDNPTGPKVYDRSFLLQFQPLCRKKPENFPALDILADEKGEATTSGYSKGSGQRERYLTGSGSYPTQGGRGGSSKDRDQQRGPPRSYPPGFTPSNTPGSNQASRSRGGPSTGGQKNYGDPLRRSGSKKHTIPTSGRGAPLGPDMAPLSATPGRWEPTRGNIDPNSDEIVLKKAKGILNKLTEETFDSLSNKLLNVITSIDVLSGVLKLVFEKALIEPKFCAMYAELCVKLSQNCPDFSTENNKFTFKRLLLNRCQEVFESSLSEAKESEMTEKNLKELSREEQIARMETEFMAKKRMLGNILFIGELFKRRMLNEKIMHECIQRLLGDINNPSHDDMEALCKMMTTIGSLLDHPKAKQYMDSYFMRIKELSLNKSLPSRIIFFLQDLLELRKNNWVTRQEANALLQTDTPTTTTTSTSTGRGSTSNFSSSDKPRNVSAIYTRHDSDKQGKVGPAASTNSPSVSRDFNKSKPLSRSGSSSSSSTQEEVKLRPQTFGPMGGSSLVYGAKGWNKPEDKPATDASAKPRSNSATRPESSAKSVKLTQEQVESRTEQLLEEYLSSRDYKEATLCIKELHAPQYSPEVVERAIQMALERKRSDVDNMAKLFDDLYRSKVIAPEHFMEGFDRVIEILEDLSIDIPKAPTMLSILYANGVLDGYLSLASLEESLKGRVKSGSFNIADLAAEVFISIAELSSDKEFRDIFAKDRIDLLSLLPSDKRTEAQLITFLEKREIASLFPMLTVGVELRDMIKMARILSLYAIGWMRMLMPVFFKIKPFPVQE